MPRVFIGRVTGGRKPRLLLSGAGMSLLGYLSLAMLAEQQKIFALDYGTRDYVRVLRYEALTLPMEMVTALGDHLGLISLIALGSLFLWPRSRRWAFALPLLMAGAGLLQWLTKWASDRPRPNEAPWGFPSGHVLSLVVLFGLMIYLIVTASRRRRRWRLLACGVGAGSVLVVAYSRLYLDKHWLSDVGGGFTVGLAYLLLAIWVVEVVLVPPRVVTREEFRPEDDGYALALDDDAGARGRRDDGDSGDGVGTPAGAGFTST